MTKRELNVYVDLQGVPVPAGRLFMRVRRGRESASFTYHGSWLAHPDRFSLDPVHLPLTGGVFNTAGGTALFAGLADSAPDRWGRNLMTRWQRLTGERRTLFESDYLLMVDDLARQGALRFRAPGEGPFLAETSPPMPPLVRLGELLAAADQVQREDSPGQQALKLLLAPGSSLGGARPKASVVGLDGRLMLAKFPAVNDTWPVCTWEHVTCRLAAQAGVLVQQTRLVEVEDRRVLLALRFDRDGVRRIPFLSAMAMLGARDDEDDHSYLEIADAVRQHGQDVTGNLEELWRRMVFNVLVTNTDDHLRNHGFLHTPQGWTLAPAYDLNPVPLDVKPRLHALLLNDQSPHSSLETVLEVADYAGLDRERALQVIREGARSTSRWRQVARAQGLGASEVERMASAFEHQDLELALRLTSPS